MTSVEFKNLRPLKLRQFALCCSGTFLHKPMALSEDPDCMLLADPSLRYINQILMEEEEEDDAAGTVSADDVSYQATFSSFYEMLSGKHSQLNSCDDSSCGHKASDVQSRAPDRSSNIPCASGHFGPSGMSLPSTGHGSCDCKGAEAGLMAKHDPGSQQGLTDEFPKLHDKRTSIADVCYRQCIMGEQEQGYDIFKLPLTDEELFSKLAEVEISFKEFKLTDIYSDLYTRSTRVFHEIQRSDNNKMGRKAREKGKLELDVLVDVEKVLMRCATAVSIGDAKMAHRILQELRQVHGASASGTGLQRIAHFFGNALEARMRGNGEHQFRTMSCKLPSCATLLQATKVGFELIPHMKVTHYYANRSILKAAEGASRLHIVDFGLTFGIQWPCLINALADRKGGPPLLVLTGIEHPQPGVNPAKRLEKSGQQLASYAQAYNVPFEYHSIVSSKWEDLDAASLNLQKVGVLVVNCIKCLSRLADEGMNLAWSTSPRQKLLTFVRSLNPNVLLTGVTHAAFNVPFFVSRFREALRYFSNVFDMLDTVWGDNPQRQVLERSFFYCDILNVVGCEGVERVKRPGTYKEWHTRITKAGFEQLPILSTVVSRSTSHAKQHFHNDFFVLDDGKGWMLMGWKGLTTFGLSAWKPKLV